MTQIHLRIADLRRQKKVTQQELADRVITGFFRDHGAAGYTFVKGHMITHGKKRVAD